LVYLEWFGLDVVELEQHNYRRHDNLCEIHNQKTFTDISNHWARESIQFIAAREITTGTGNNRFSPDATLTRAMFVTFIARFDGVDLSKYTESSFSDVTADRDNWWYMAAVEWAAEIGVTNGVGGGRFDPHSSITHEQMVTMLNRYLNYKEYSLNDAAGTGTARFTALDILETWSVEAVTEFSAKGILNSRSDRTGFVFSPHQAATRADMATLLERFIRVIKD